jgi:hypothetical protein
MEYLLLYVKVEEYLPNPDEYNCRNEYAKRRINKEEKFDTLEEMNKHIEYLENYDRYSTTYYIKKKYKIEDIDYN